MAREEFEDQDPENLNEELLEEGEGEEDEKEPSGAPGWFISIGVHSLFAIGCWLIACGLPGGHLSLGCHFVVMPLASAMGVIPLAMGPLEYVLDILYARVSAAQGLVIIKGQGFVVALAYRLITVLIAALGAYYYLGNRREMSEVIHEAEQQQG